MKVLGTLRSEGFLSYTDDMCTNRWGKSAMMRKAEKKQLALLLYSACKRFALCRGGECK